MKEDSLIVPEPDKVMRSGVRGFIIVVGTLLNSSILFPILMGILSLEYKERTSEKVHLNIFGYSAIILVFTTVLLTATHAPERKLCYWFMLLPTLILLISISAQI